VGWTSASNSDAVRVIETKNVASLRGRQLGRIAMRESRSYRRRGTQRRPLQGQPLVVDVEVAHGQSQWDGEQTDRD
jgi:hypothetical protein